MRCEAVVPWGAFDREVFLLKSQAVAQYLPFLRRYARALTGSQMSGDAYVSATLEALIKKMPTRFKSELPEIKPLFEKDKTAGELIEVILSKYPQHKGVLFLQSKYNNNQPLSVAEVDELKKFKQVLKL